MSSSREEEEAEGDESHLGEVGSSGRRVGGVENENRRLSFVVGLELRDGFRLSGGVPLDDGALDLLGRESVLDRVDEAELSEDENVLLLGRRLLSNDPDELLHLGSVLPRVSSDGFEKL